MKLIKALSGFSIAATLLFMLSCDDRLPSESVAAVETGSLELAYVFIHEGTSNRTCLLYTSPSPRDATLSRMPSSA